MGPLWQAADLITPWAIRVAATLRIAEHIADGAGTDHQLAQRTGADEATLRRLMRHLVAERVFGRNRAGVYTLGALGRELLGPVRDWIDADGAVGRGDLAFVALLHTVRTGEPGYAQLYGVEYWEDLDRNPALSRSLDELMSHDPPVGDVIDGYDWSTVAQVADVGGGQGAVLAELLAAQPHLTGMLVERSGPGSAAKQALGSAGVLDRCQIVEGSFFDPLPRGADVYLLCRVLNDWDDEHASAILRRCAQALPPSGCVVVVEDGGRIASEDEHVSTDMDLRMLVYCRGADRTLTDLARVAEAAGLAVTDTYQGGQSALIVLEPATTAG